MNIEFYGRPYAIGSEFDDYFIAERSAIISIDMHRSHLDAGGDCPSPAPRASEIIAPIDAFHDRARALGIPVVHIRTVLRRGGVDDVKGIAAAWRRTWPIYAGPNDNSGDHAIEGTKWTDFVTRVETDDLVINTKKRLSVFYSTDLDFLLRNLRKEVVVINGGFTDCRVLNAAFDASNLNYRVVVLRDLVRGTDAELERAALAIISLNLGLVVEQEDLLNRWRVGAERSDVEGCEHG